MIHQLVLLLNLMYVQILIMMVLMNLLLQVLIGEFIGMRVVHVEDHLDLQHTIMKGYL